ncbi:hypothetical protein [Streptomyces sp. CC224B]|uniref:hypothetical protein n=1 Tax=Streptomyces sp. CC224B TaxID=3044571 RepID=UPI0024A83051|nr:hypothetical protein [Streptomyces sp. CC224B]
MRRIGEFTVERRLGAGGMGIVYLACSAAGRQVVLKVIRPEYADDPLFRARFRREVAAARRVSGAFTASVVDADPDGDPPWLAAQYVVGESLAARVRAPAARCRWWTSRDWAVNWRRRCATSIGRASCTGT